MYFRSSFYSLADSADPYLMTWLEAHEVKEGYVIAQLTGEVSRVRALWLLCSPLFNRDKHRPSTLPKSATILTKEPNAEEALKAIFSQESRLATVHKHKLADIGEHKYAVDHYVNLLAAGKLPRVLLPERIVTAAQEFSSYIDTLYLIDEAPRGVMENARSRLSLYKKLATIEA